MAFLKLSSLDTTSLLLPIFGQSLELPSTQVQLECLGDLLDYDPIIASEKALKRLEEEGQAFYDGDLASIDTAWGGNNIVVYHRLNAETSGIAGRLMLPLVAHPSWSLVVPPDAPKRL